MIFRGIFNSRPESSGFNNEESASKRGTFATFKHPI